MCVCVGGGYFLKTLLDYCLSSIREFFVHVQTAPEQCIFRPMHSNQGCNNEGFLLYQRHGTSILKIISKRALLFTYDAENLVTSLPILDV